MKNLSLIVAFLFLIGCASGGGVSVESISIPEVQSIEYKDIVSCSLKEDEPGYSLCTIKHSKSGFGVTVKIKTSDVPTEPAPTISPTVPE